METNASAKARHVTLIPSISPWREEGCSKLGVRPGGGGMTPTIASRPFILAMRLILQEDSKDCRWGEERGL